MSEPATKHVTGGTNPRKTEPAKTKTAVAKIKQVTGLQQLLTTLKITRWDYLLVGDGSCTGKWEYEAGFGCMVVPQRDPAAFYSRHGAFDRGTNIVAEMMAYVLPLMYIAATEKISVRHIHIVTDCEYLPKAASNPQWQTKANAELWNMLNMFKRRGLLLHWHWIPRDTLDLNKFCHDLANAARVSMKGLSQQNMAKHTFTTIDVNAKSPEETTETTAEETHDQETTVEEASE